MMSRARRPTDRLDRILVARGLAPTRAKAQALILAGRVWSQGSRLDKAGLQVTLSTPLEVAPGRTEVSRGARKLEPALLAFAIDVRQRDVLDVGASTGGFTQVLLQQGARRVIALDVGRGQLDWSLRQDERVLPLEGVNARYLTQELLPYRPALAVVDVSFISLELVLPPVAACLVAEGGIVALVKPQFEVGRGQVGRGGIVRDPALHLKVLQRLAAFAERRGYGLLGGHASRLRGADGNQEFFLHLRPSGGGLNPREIEVELRRTVEEARA